MSNTTRPDGGGSYFLTSEAGLLIASYRGRTREFFIFGIDVNSEQRGQGEGKRLLSAALEVARQIGALSITSSVTSRECLAAMSKVFGQNALEVVTEGTFTPSGEECRYDTLAFLNYNVAENQEVS